MEDNIREIRQEEKKPETTFSITKEYVSLFGVKVPMWLIAVIVILLLIYLFFIRGKRRTFNIGDVTFTISSESPLETEMERLIERQL